MGFFAKRSKREKLVPARDAAVGRHAKETFEGSGEAGYVFGSDALEITIAANGTVSRKFAGNRNQAGAEACTATGASPRQPAENGSGEIHEVTSARAAAGRRVAGGANHQSCSFE